MGNELLSVVDTLEKMRGIDRETLLSVIEESLLGAARKAVRASREVSVKIDRATGEIKCMAKLFIVEKIDCAEEQISLREVQAKYGEAAYTKADLGREIEWEVTPEDFGRIAAQNAKQAIFQKLRQVEKRNACEQFKDQVGTLITGEVRRLDHNDVIILFGTTEGAMRREDRIPGEDYQAGDVVTALLLEINEDKPGACLFVSRSHPDFVVRLFEREVSEIADGTVEIRAIAREAGDRSTIAVAPPDPRVDPVGACVGQHGNRVKTIVRELGGEKVDIIKWDEDILKFVENALKPAQLQSVEVNEQRRAIRIEVPEDQLSLSIGKRGLNARLASRLTGWKLDIVPAASKEESAETKFEEQKRQAIESLVKALEVTEAQAEALVGSGFTGVEMVRDAELADLMSLAGLDEEQAKAVQAKAANS